MFAEPSISIYKLTVANTQNSQKLVFPNGFFFFKLEFIPCNAEQPLQGMELQEKETQKDKAHRNLFRNNLQLKDVC